MGGKIPFNKPFLSGSEGRYIEEAVQSGHIAGNGSFTKKCHGFFAERYGFSQSFLTSSCTDALEMAAILANVEAGCEVIIPSYTFVSTANAFALRGAQICFADTQSDFPNISASAIEALITPRTKVIVVVHYAGVACEMDAIAALAKRHGIILIEDAAHAIDSYYHSKPLGSIGDFSTFSFHETKNIICGEGGLLVVNNPDYSSRAEIVWQKGTDRSSFDRGEVGKYSWRDLGSSYYPSDITAAYLYAQLENLEKIQLARVKVWSKYHHLLQPLEQAGKIQRPVRQEHSTINGHLYYILCADCEERERLIRHLWALDIYAVFHYVPLHSSPYFLRNNEQRYLPHTDRFANCLLRLPLFYELQEAEQEKIVSAIFDFYGAAA